MKQLLVFLLLLCSASVSAQDVIVKKDGSTVVCRVVELTESEIVYKKWSDLNGSNYVMERSAASAINYQNGKKVNFSEATNLYMPNSQNDGVQQYNDRALLQLDAAAHNYSSPKVNTFKTIGWIGGCALVAAGGLIQIMAAKEDGKETERRVTGGILMGSGVLWTVGFFISAHFIDKKERAQMLESSTIYQFDFNLNNASSLSAGIDMLSDHTIGKNTLGLGIRYNF